MLPKIKWSIKNYTGKKLKLDSTDNDQLQQLPLLGMVFNETFIFVDKSSKMNKIIRSGLVASIILLAFAYLCLLLMPILLPKVAEEYYNPAFVNDETRNMLYYLHPVVLAFGLAWFWNRFKSLLKGNALMQGIEMALIYAAIATMPSLLILYSAIDVTLLTVGSWLLYGFFQALIAGIIFSRMHV